MSSQRLLSSLTVLAMLTACQGHTDTSQESDTDTDADTDADTDTDTDADVFVGLDRYVPAGEPVELTDIGANLSGITYSPATGTYFLVKDSGSRIFEYAADLSTLLREIVLTDVHETDNEGIAHLGDSWFAITNEGNKPVILSIPDDGSTQVDGDPDSDAVQELVLPPAGRRNRGVEGICYDPRDGGRFYAVQEMDPMMVYTFQRPDHGEDIGFEDELVVEELFDPEVALDGVAIDLSGCEYNPLVDRLLIVSHESSVLLDVSLSGEVMGQLELEGADKFEGVTLGPDLEIVVVSEPDTVRVYTPQ